ncbi:MAG TPA: LysR family transcriptional regulator [Marmoricola sp.]
MELRHIRSFLALAEERHFGRAATRVHIAQSALSQQIRQLERELGVELFARTTRRVDLTDAGRAFEAHARAIEARVHRATGEASMIASGHAGRVSIGFVGTATYDVLPRLARRVREELPDVELDLRGEMLNPELLDALAAGDLDLGLIRPDVALPDDLEVRRLRSERLVAVLPASHRLAGRRRIALTQLAGESFVVHSSGGRSSIHDHVLRACAEAGFSPPDVTEVGETATLVVFVAAGLGVALVPEPVRSLGLEGVSYVALSKPPTIDLALATPAEATSPPVRRVAAVVEDLVRT